MKAPVVDYLRVSITDRCNLRCVYCMPAEGVKSLPHGEVMRYEELRFFVRAAFESGIRRVRLTGGEPLIRKGAPDFVGMLAGIDPELRISLTTNGTLLARHAADLKRAGLSRVNISIDSLEPEVYRRITRSGELGDALEGLEAAIEVGLDPVKINVVVLKGINDDPYPFARLTYELPVHVRFIEYMPYFGERGSWFVPTQVILERLERIGVLEEVGSPEGWGPANYLRLRGAPGTIGFISPVSRHFCPSCNRLRVSSEGLMRTCLFDSDGVDVKRLIRAGASLDSLREIIDGELERKRAGRHRHGGRERMRACDHMSRIGG